MSFILGFLKNIKLSISQWLLVSAAAIIGILVLMLKLKGSKIHALQVELLRQHADFTDKLFKEKMNELNKTTEQQKVKSTSATQTFLNEYNEYLQNHKP